MRLAALTCAGAAIALLAAANGSLAARSAVSCAAWAAPTGDDAGAGTKEKPFRTVGRLLQVLSPGRTGCLASGATFPEHLVIGAQGSTTAPVSLTTPTGALATIGDGIEFTQAARSVVINRVIISMSGAEPANSLPAAVIIRGFRITLSRSQVSGGGIIDKSRSCVLLDHARRALIDRNVLHECAIVKNNPATTGQGVHVSVAVAAQVTNNTIWSTPGAGVALSPNAQLTTVSRNVIDGAETGIFFGGDAKTTSNGNRVEHNIISYAGRFAVAGSNSTGGPVGKLNVVTKNCFWMAGQSSLAGSGYAAPANRTVDPRYLNRPATFALKPSSPCWSYRPLP
jgi:hypothetical protein